MEVALRTEKRAACFAFWLVTALGAQPLEFAVRHDHRWRDRPGILRIAPEGISYQEASAKKPSQHRWSWAWHEIQQLYLSEDRLTILSYQDNLWQLGADRRYSFLRAGGPPFSRAYPWLRQQMDQRLVVALADDSQPCLWEVPVKLQGRLRGSHGVLRVSEDTIVYRSDRRGQSRTWRYTDIDNLTSSGPFELTIVTFERSLWHYGGRRLFQFQLKEPLDPERYNELWLRWQQRAKGLRLLGRAVGP